MFNATNGLKKSVLAPCNIFFLKLKIKWMYKNTLSVIMN